MRMELICFDDSPNPLPARDLLRAIVREEGVKTDLSEIEVKEVCGTEVAVHRIANHPNRRTRHRGRCGECGRNQSHVPAL
jgi:hypothetical protein